MVSCNSEVVRKRGFQQVSELGVNMSLLMPCSPPIREHERRDTWGTVNPRNHKTTFHARHPRSLSRKQPASATDWRTCRSNFFWSIAVGEIRHPTTVALDIREIKHKILCKIHITRWVFVFDDSNQHFNE